MGEDEWAHREPGSVTGSVVPPPAVPDEPPPPIRPPLPRRQPKASGHQRAADANQLITPVRRVSGSTGPEPSGAGPARAGTTQAGPTRAGTTQAGPTRAGTTQAGPARAGTTTQAGPTQARSSQARPARRNAGPDQRRLLLAQEAAPPPQPPDNVRYLFRPVLTQTALAVDPADAEAEDDNAEQSNAERSTAARTSVGNAGAPAVRKPRSQPGESPPSQPARPKTAGTAGSHRRGAAARPGRKLRRRVIWAAAVIVAAATAASTAFVLVRQGPPAGSGRQSPASQQTPASQRSPGTQPQHSTGSTGSTGGNNGRGLPGLSSAAIVRAQAARWVDKEISKSAIIACDAEMCTELFNQGIAASNLLVLSPTAPSPLGADIVIGTPAIRSQFGRRLAGEYAPTVIASFGFGKSRVDVRVVAPDGAVAYELALSRDLAARQRYGGVLLRNSRISVSASAQPDLIAGLVDPRLLMMLPVLASQHPIRILGFYDRAPRSAQGVPLSGAELAGYDAAAGLSADGYLRWLLVFLRGQRAPLWPTSVTTALVGGHEIVQVRFSRPSPIGLLNGQ
jgi:hypothetical protein